MKRNAPTLTINELLAKAFMICLAFTIMWTDILNYIFALILIANSLGVRGWVLKKLFLGIKREFIALFNSTVVYLVANKLLEEGYLAEIVFEII
jgi:hypothetical protein